MCLACGSMMILPERVRDWLRRFPRRRSAGWILATVVLVWWGTRIYHSPLGHFEQYRNLLFILIPLAIVLCGYFVEELLAPRALGALLILVPVVMLDAARWHESPLRLVMAVFAYLLIIKGCVLVVAPYWFRKGAERLIATDKQCRVWGAFGAGFGTLFIWLGFGVY